MDMFTMIHTGLSLVALVAGIVVVVGLLGARLLPGWTALYLATAVATSVTGFGFPVHAFMASHAIGVISLVVLGLAIVARYGRKLAGSWRWIYVLGVVISAYFLVFVTIAQAFMKLPALMAAAPTLSEPPFALSQLVALVLFVVLAIAAARVFRPQSGLAQRAA
jgi:hypothetical protein